jgi:hypothetical protein
MSEERTMKFIRTEGDGVVEITAPTMDGGKSIAGVVETVLTVDGNFTKMPDYIMVRGTRYVPSE